MVQSLQKRKAELESELEAAQNEYKCARDEAIKVRKDAERAEATIQDLSNKLDAEKHNAEKRKQLISLLGPNSKENQEKVRMALPTLHNKAAMA